VIVYYGAIAEWFDWPLWIHAAKARPNWSFVLIGQSYDNNPAGVRARAAASPNIHYLGPKPYPELARYMHFVDVATIPFLLNSVTHSCSPVKMFEYMATGKPIVATAMHEVLKYDSVLVAHTPAEFVERLEEACIRTSDPTYQSLLRKEAERNTWGARAAAYIEALRSASTRFHGKPRRAMID
jgi:glycosyltransferase involved in cell wall biosynthesis